MMIKHVSMLTERVKWSSGSSLEVPEPHDASSIEQSAKREDSIGNLMRLIYL